MKKIFSAAALSLCAAGLAAQPTAYDAEKLSNNELNGTARFVGMGGALGALGGDISTISTNPAGTALYRRSDIMITAGFDQHQAKMGGFNESHTQARLNNIGLVVPFPVHSSNILTSVNFGFQYQRRNNFYKNLTLSRVLQNGISQLGQAAAMAEGMAQEEIGGDKNYNPFGNSNVGWLPLAAVKMQLMKEGNDGVYSYGYLQDVDGFALPSQAQSAFSSVEEGGIDQTDFSFSFNFNDRFYLGATIGYYYVDYTKNTFYREAFDDPGLGELGYNLYSDNWIHGDGVDFKLGAIVRPIEESSFRIGFAVHTPVFYRLTLTTGFDADAVYEDVDLETGDRFAVGYNGENVVSSYDNMNGYPIDQDFRLRTPWLFNVSLGYTIGTNIALGAEYEYEDYGSCNLKGPDGSNYLFGNSEIDSQLKGVHTLRLGGEYKIMPEVALRLGYNYSSSAYGEGSYKIHASNSINTDTEYTNREALHQLTAGIGVRLTSNVYMDLAYKYLTQQGDFYAFDHVSLDPVSLSEQRHSFLATLGYRF